MVRALPTTEKYDQETIVNRRLMLPHASHKTQLATAPLVKEFDGVEFCCEGDLPPLKLDTTE